MATQIKPDGHGYSLHLDAETVEKWGVKPDTPLWPTVFDGMLVITRE